MSLDSMFARLQEDVGNTITNLTAENNRLAAENARLLARIAKLESREDFECDVCLEEDRPSKATFESCSHSMCQACYRQMFQHGMGNCPFCRVKIAGTVIRPVNRRV